MTNIIPFPARAPKPRHPFTDPMLIAAIEAGYAAPLCECERNGGRLHIECVAKRDCKEYRP